jgi:PHS family inorganic phosphate transporter-like MFS transporter
MAEMASSTADYVHLEQQELPTTKDDVIIMHSDKKTRKKTIKRIISTLITALGNFSVQYNFQAISISLIIMSVQECTLTPEKCRNGVQASWVTGTATATIFAGAIAGQMTVRFSTTAVVRFESFRSVNDTERNETVTKTRPQSAFFRPLQMGYAGDVLGRNQAMTLTLGIASIAAMLSATAPAGSPTDVYVIIIVFRFILGVGLGGVYPLSATKVRAH